MDCMDVYTALAIIVLGLIVLSIVITFILSLCGVSVDFECPVVIFVVLLFIGNMLLHNSFGQIQHNSKGEPIIKYIEEREWVQYK